MNNVGNEMIVMMLMTSQIYIYDKHQDIVDAVYSFLWDVIF